MAINIVLKLLIHKKVSDCEELCRNLKLKFVGV